ncbi:N-acetylglucosamine-6-phosphate deacetylase, partial [Eurytemora carolleeae]|uniref:N-acetylglucosamine-6-phosphate deacetylase n=1 Tax=Eurytemora carolleeae TaxID=1294199 RepID=UPI000C779307
KWTTKRIDCQGRIITPGFIDLQINGAFGVDFSCDIKDKESADQCIRTVGRGILAHGVTSYCPTVVTSPPEVYSTILPFIQPRKGGKDGATVLGVHVEGPFINLEKKGAHPTQCIRSPTEGFKSVREMYGPGLKNVSIITLAPELEGSMDAIQGCVETGILVSLGHTQATLSEGEEAVRRGAGLITHLFNAMPSFHHRDPGLIGLLTSTKLNNNKIQGMFNICFQDGKYQFGQQQIEVRGDEAYVAGTSTLTGSVATMHKSILKFRKSSRCSLVECLEAASLHPAQALGIDKTKGSLNYGSDADLVFLEPADLGVISTWIDGRMVYEANCT